MDSRPAGGSVVSYTRKVTLGWNRIENKKAQYTEAGTDNIKDIRRKRLKL